MDKIDNFLGLLSSDQLLSDDIVSWHHEEARAGKFQPLPPDLHISLKNSLIAQNISDLYSHQIDAWNAIRAGKNVIITTGTASGKTLCYNLPILQSLTEHPNQTAMYIFPTRALAQDQLKSIIKFQQPDHTTNNAFNSSSPTIRASIIDGDTPSHMRPGIKGKVNFLLTNPDMLHIGILPHHTTWKRLFENLRFVVIDEAHTYRGIFGSHVANLVRRLIRVCHFYGSDPLFILTSATIANPLEHASNLVDKPFDLISSDGAPSHGRTMVIVNPTIINSELGLRRGANHEAAILAPHLLSHDVQSILFTRSRRSVELLLKEITNKNDVPSGWIRGYRSGYLASERRSIEAALKSGELRMVISTNALELGMDIGSVDAVVIIGYPGTLAAIRQQAGRAGRRHNRSAAIFIASQNPIDQYLVNHSDYMITNPVEKALINPDNLAILYAHLRCALFELPFLEREKFGALDDETVLQILRAIEETREVRITEGKAFWTGSTYPASQVSLRSAGGDRVHLYVREESENLVRIGEVDRDSATWMVHEGAVYLHQGEAFLVRSLNLEQGEAIMEPSWMDYYTEPVRELNIEIVETIDECQNVDLIKFVAEALVSSSVTGYRMITWAKREIVGTHPLSLPPNETLTECLGISLSSQVVNNIKQLGLWTSEENNYGPEWASLREQVRRRDGYKCRVCGIGEGKQQHHIHHKVPLKAFTSRDEANTISNLITLCPSCHRKAENVVRLRSGLSGLSYILHHLACLFLMCDIEDLGRYSEPQSKLADGNPIIILYELAQGGTGLSRALFGQPEDLLFRAKDLIASCPCLDGCPSCVGPGGEAGLGGKQETLAIIDELLIHSVHG
ncbi:MAG: DEAD/DEAH box helicase [Anaerolineae bacterium]|nr:DEAD/DEAH box helicase [Anaerolineae bacterium]